MAAAEAVSLEKKVEDRDDYIPRAFRWAMESSSSSSLTIGEHNKNTNACRGSAWIILVFLPSMFIATSVGSAYIMYNEKPAIRGDGGGFPWFLPVVMLWGVYMAVVLMAMWHSTLFLPEAPFAALEALRHVGFEKIGITAGLTSALALFFDLTCMLWSCIAAVLLAAVIAFWVWLVRVYGKDYASIKRGLATSLALSTILTAVLIAFMIRLVRFSEDAQARIAREGLQ
ncbi:unnamed protein product [Urochloa decumbens]|uniref:DUF7378 domain-containing protein n=1 Tax=Urochloa decumbens TaxID=240449 RepID=A0ABC9D9D7_9POAL